MGIERDGLDGDGIATVLLDTAADELDHTALLGEEVHVGLGDVADARDGQAARASAVEAHGCGDDGLVGHIDAVDVGRGVALGVAHLLSLMQRLAEIDPELAHGVDDVVGGSVHDAHERRDGVGAAGLGDGCDPRDAAAHRRLDVE